MATAFTAATATGERKRDKSVCTHVQSTKKKTGLTETYIEKTFSYAFGRKQNCNFVGDTGIVPSNAMFLLKLYHACRNVHSAEIEKVGQASKWKICQ